MSPVASWTFDPGVVTALALYSGVYLVRWKRARTPTEPHPPSVGRLLVFLGGILVFAAALCSPIDRLAEQLLVMHMVQHVLLLDVGPILLILGLTKVLMRPATRRVHWLEQHAGVLAAPLFAVVLYSGVMWAWHVPALYDAAAKHTGIHVLEHLSFTLAGFLYWWHLISPVATRLRREGTTPIVYMLSTKVTVGFLGILLTFAPTALFGYYAHQPHWWGIDARGEQALAGAVMALEQAIVMGIALAVLFVRMLAQSEREEQRRERYELA
ncbi:MAG TPA: cytochrome c oxidase assembly protein [Conexibacter sp.]|nr:cytochrome c oxidase assembly protein [Conexibacter sp.]